MGLNRAILLMVLAGVTHAGAHLESQLGWNILNDITPMKGPQLGQLEQLGAGLTSLPLSFSPSVFSVRVAELHDLVIQGSQEHKRRSCQAFLGLVPRTATMCILRCSIG